MSVNQHFVCLYQKNETLLFQFIDIKVIIEFHPIKLDNFLLILNMV